jgi:CDP-paratose 2-epimerase
LDFYESDTRYELFEDDIYYNGIDELLSVDQCKHSLFGCSKLAADVYVQEYGRYFGMKTTVFRGGCLTGARHKGAQLHGFLNYLVKCNLKKIPYTIFGYKGKQVRDNIHASDLIEAFYEVIRCPRVGEVYNIGGSRHSNCSILEAITMVEDFTKIPMQTKYVDTNRSGDHIWWISDIKKFQSDYPNWKLKYTIEDIIKEIIEHI